MTARLNAFRAAVVAGFKAVMPELGSCAEQFGRFDLDELETNIVRTPAVRVAILSSTVKPIADGRAGADLNCAAFVVADGPDRDRQAWTIAEAIATQLHPAQLFGLTHLTAPSDVKAQPVMSTKTKMKAVVIMAVEWKQQVRNLGETIFDESAHLLRELYINDELVPLEDENG